MQPGNELSTGRHRCADRWLSTTALSSLKITAGFSIFSQHLPNIIFSKINHLSKQPYIVLLMIQSANLFLLPVKKKTKKNDRTLNLFNVLLFFFNFKIGKNKFNRSKNRSKIEVKIGLHFVLSLKQYKVASKGGLFWEILSKCCEKNEKPAAETIGPRNGAGPWRVRYRAAYFSRTLEYISNACNCLCTFSQKKTKKIRN